MTFDSAADQLAILTQLGGDVALYNGTSVTGLLDRDYIEVGGMESSAPIFVCRIIDVPDLEHGDLLSFGADDYRVREVRDDGTGVATLILEAQ